MICDFVRNLLDGRPVHVGPPERPSGADVQGAVEVIELFEKDYRLELPGEPPDFAADAAGWSVTSMYLAASLLVHRDADAKTISKLLRDRPPDRHRCESHYAVDLTMRFLPDLIKLAKSAASDDPLLAHLLTWAHQWPLSSVSIPGVGDVDTAPLRTSPMLMRLYVDRILAAEDIRRLKDPAVQEAVAVAIGDHPELSPNVARTLNELLAVDDD